MGQFLVILLLFSSLLIYSLAVFRYQQFLVCSFSNEISGVAFWGQSGGRVVIYWLFYCYFSCWVQILPCQFPPVIDFLSLQPLWYISRQDNFGVSKAKKQVFIGHFIVIFHISLLCSLVVCSSFLFFTLATTPICLKGGEFWASKGEKAIYWLFYCYFYCGLLCSLLVCSCY